ncbi:hypothetical protein U1Q18_015691 [Sarracenia purpurea var. burkii]
MTAPTTAGNPTAVSVLLCSEVTCGPALEPDPSLYNWLLNKCALLGKLREGRIVHTHFLRSQFSHYLVIQNTVVNMYGKCGSVDDASEVFDDVPTLGGRFLMG